MVPNEIVWTRQQQVNTLAAIDIMKTYLKADRERSGANAVVEHSTQIGADGVIAGLINLCGTLAKHISELTADEIISVIYKAEVVAKNVRIAEE